MKNVLSLGLLMSALLLGVSPCSADVAPVTLEKLIKVCEYAVVAKVTKIIDVDGAKLAEARVLTTLKGKSRKGTIFFIAQPIGIEDTSRAVLNETVLLFLESEPPGVDESSPFRQKEREVIGNNQLWLIAWSGRGRLPVTRIGRTDYIRVLADTKLAEVRLPKEIATMPYPEPNNSRLRLAKLDDVVTFIKRKART